MSRAVGAGFAGVVALCLALVTDAVRVEAQQFRGAVGYAIPNGALARRANPGPSIQLGAEWQQMPSMLAFASGVRADVLISTLSAKRDSAGTRPSRILNRGILATFVWRVPGMWVAQPYALGGGGALATSGDAHLRFGLSGAIGVDARIGEAPAFVELRRHRFADRSGGGALSPALTTLHVGLRF
jgi:hypothetical protein